MPEDDWMADLLSFLLGAHIRVCCYSDVSLTEDRKPSTRNECINQDLRYTYPVTS